MTGLLIDVHRYLSRGAGAIELDEVDALPRAEDELSVAIGPGKRTAEDARQEMRVGVPLAVREADLRHERAQGFRQIFRHTGIGVLIDRDRAGRVRYDDRGDAVAARESAEDTLHVRSDDEDLLARRGADGECCLAQHGEMVAGALRALSAADAALSAALHA